MEKIQEFLSDERGFRYALPALFLAAFHMVVAYAILAVGPGFAGPGDDFIPGLFEGLIGITLYAGLAICVLKSILAVRITYILDFIGLVAVALVWLIILVIVNHARTSKPVVPGHEPGSVVSDAVQQAEEPVFQTVHMEESELDALIVPETPSISVLKMSKSPGVRESL